MGCGFEDLEVWKRSKQLAVEVCQSMQDSKLFGLRDQMLRSAVSVPSNIAEGSERNGHKEFSCFIGYARGSLAELRTQIMIAAELNEIPKTKAAAFIQETKELAKMLYRLRQSQRPAKM